MLTEEKKNYVIKHGMLHLSDLIYKCLSLSERITIGFYGFDIGFEVFIFI